MRRFDAYSSALKVLSRAREQDLSNEFIQGGIIYKFALQFELGWKTLKDLLRYEGDAVSLTGSPRDILKAANRYFGFIDEDTWLSMLKDRNSIMHVYDQAELQRLLERILDRYIPCFEAMGAAILAEYGEELGDMA